jgi:hypothetical protein
MWACEDSEVIGSFRVGGSQAGAVLFPRSGWHVLTREVTVRVQKSAHCRRGPLLQADRCRLSSLDSDREGFPSSCESEASFPLGRGSSALMTSEGCIICCRASLGNMQPHDPLHTKPYHTIPYLAYTSHPLTFIFTYKTSAILESQRCTDSEAHVRR